MIEVIFVGVALVALLTRGWVYSPAPHEAITSALLVVLVQATALLGGHALAQRESIPVRVELPLPAGVKTPDDAARLWKKDKIQVKLENAAGVGSRQVRCCAEYESARGLGYSSDPKLGRRCLALLLKKTLRSPRQSFVRDFKLNAKTVGSLPAILGFAVGERSYQEEVDRAIENGTSFGSYFITLNDHLKLAVEKAKPLHLTFRTDGPDEPDLYIIDVVGWGDWNGDGLDDLALETYHGYLRNASESCLLILSRKSSTDRFRIVDGRCHLSDNAGDDAPKPIERRFRTLNIDTSCAGDVADEERARFDKRSRSKELAPAYTSLFKLYDRCRTRLAAPQRGRLVSALILGAHRLKKQADCRLLVGQRTANEIYASERSRKALLNNIKRCLPGERIVDPRQEP